MNIQVLIIGIDVNGNQIDENITDIDEAIQFLEQLRDEDGDVGTPTSDNKVS